MMDTEKRKIRIGALISGGGSNLQAVIDGCASGAIDGEVAFVGSDNPGAGGLKRAKKCGIPRFVVDYSSIIRRYKNDPAAVHPPAGVDISQVAERIRLFPKDDTPAVRAFLTTRLHAEALLIDKMQGFAFDLVILAGFMRNLTPYFIDRINMSPDRPRIMNIHPSLLPAFPGTDGYGDTFRHGCKVGGCTVHFIDYGEDTGPIIGQKAFEIKDDDTLDAVRTRGLAMEWRLYPECIQLFAQNRLRCAREIFKDKNGQTVKRTVVHRLPESTLS